MEKVNQEQINILVNFIRNHVSCDICSMNPKICVNRGNIEADIDDCVVNILEFLYLHASDAYHIYGGE